MGPQSCARSVVIQSFRVDLCFLRISRRLLLRVSHHQSLPVGESDVTLSRTSSQNINNDVNVVFLPDFHTRAGVVQTDTTSLFRHGTLKLPRCCGKWASVSLGLIVVVGGDMVIVLSLCCSILSFALVSDLFYWFRPFLGIGPGFPSASSSYFCFKL